MALKCLSCGRMYTGYECPTCGLKHAIAREAEATRDAYRESSEAAAAAYEAAAERTAEASRQSARDIEFAVEQAAQEQRDAIANAHVLQSEAQLRQAGELARAGLHDDAIHHLTAALELNRANLDAVIRLAESLLAVGRRDEGLTYLIRAFKLVETRPYAGVIAYYQWLADHAVHNMPGMKDAFLRNVRAHLMQSGSENRLRWAHVLERLGCTAEATQVTAAARSELATARPHDLEAQTEADRLLIATGQGPHFVDEWLGRVDREHRASALDEFRRWQEKKPDAEVLQRVSAALQQKRASWSATTEQEIAAEARKSGNAAADAAHLGCGAVLFIGIAAFFGGYLLWGFGLSLLLTGGLNPPPEYHPLIIGGAYVFGLVLAVGLPLRLVVQRQRSAERKALDMKLGELRAREASVWRSLDAS